MEQQTENISRTQTIEQPTSIENTKKSNIVVILLSVLLLISIMVAGFFAYQTQNLVKELNSLKTNTQKVEPTPVSTSDPTADWKTYVNDFFGFSFYYPKDYKLVTDGWEKIGDNPNGHYAIKVGDPSGEFNIDIDIRMLFSRMGGNYKETVVANITAYEDLDSVGKYVFFEKGGYSYDIQVLGLDSNKANTEANLIFDQILSTFKFDKSVQFGLPQEILTLFSSVNKELTTNIKIQEENSFYTPSGNIDKKSWKLDLTSVLNSKETIAKVQNVISDYYVTNDQESAGGAGTTVSAFVGKDTKCYLMLGFDKQNYLTCSLK